jgi:cellulose synthase/poly-beta-1,6-N-acetylglucosamine synthase-like glycosyltransferase/spore germination protein YaaH/peptidoglycan/xylan/chitin deacetylase (PgdA/CDA1 family)
MNTPQVFQTKKPLRWNSVKWTTRILAMVGIFLFVILGLALFSGSLPTMPNLQSKAKYYQLQMNPSSPLTMPSHQNKKIKGFKKFLIDKEKEDSIRKLKKYSSENNAEKIPYVRAAFYTPWTAATSLPDLEKYGDKLNTIFPEWFFIDTKTLRLQTRIDSAGLAQMRLKRLRIMPMISNFNSSLKDFDGKLLHRILADTIARNKLIKQITDTLNFYHFSGLNVDFEELIENTSQPLTSFQKKLYESLHAMNFTVTMDVEPKNQDYDYKKLSDYNDYIILMAYDQSNNSTDPGPISAQKWIEESLDWTAARIDHKKIILGIGGFGYDWSQHKNDSVETYTYNKAINQAKALNAKIIYDNDSYNLHYSYIAQRLSEEGKLENVMHQVWFTDAATTFNILRFSDEYSTAGTALWRLGSEDTRMWNFYNMDISNEGLQTNPFKFNSLSTIPIIPDNVGFVGEGEMLDILYSPQEGKIKFEIDSTDQLISEQEYLQLPSGYVIRRFAEDTTEGKGHKLILTFDDGPSDEYTPQILDILEREKIPATFFIVGLAAESNIPILQRIYNDGFEIGNHTFTHHNIAKMSLIRAEIEMKATRLLIETITGRSTILFRAPYNADSEPQTYEELEPIARSRNENYLTVAESIDPMDWQVGVKKDSIVSRVINQVEARNASIILLHDAGGKTRQATVDALPEIIKYFKDRGYKFTTVADLMGATKDVVMPPVPLNRDGWIMKLNFFLAESAYWGGQILFSLFIIGIVLSVGRMTAMAILASIQKRKEASGKKGNFLLFNNIQSPLVSVIIPAYNEQVNAVRTVNSLIAQHYPNLEVIFVDDGSKDKTYQIVKDAFETVVNVHVFTKPNGGKATALNFGIENCNAEYIVCIDADTQLKSDAVSHLMKYFENENVAAVAGNVKVGNEVNVITKWQSIEYITSQNFDRRAFDLLNCITVVPGAIGAFKKEAVKISGGFTSDTLAEDCDLTMRLHRNGYSIRNCAKAISYTEAPETFRQFMRQRFRWSFGVMQCFWKHRDTVLNPKYKNFGMVAMPNILIFQMILPFLAPLADMILAVSLIAASLNIVVASVPHILLYYGIFSLVDLAGAALAFAFEKENYKKLFWMIPQRLIYRQMMYYILIKSFNRAIKGELQGWGAMKRTGSVKRVAVS